MGTPYNWLDFSNYSYDQILRLALLGLVVISLDFLRRYLRSIADSQDRDKREESGSHVDKRPRAKRHAAGREDAQ